MTGTVTWEILAWVIGVQTTTITIVLGAVFWVQRQLASERDARAKVKDELAQFREEVARNYATTETLRQIEERMEAGFNRLGDRFDNVMAKLIDTRRSSRS